jgi:hypothetical protein
MGAGARSFVAALGIAATVLVTSCTRVIDDARVVAAPDMGKAEASADSSKCAPVDAPLATIPAHGITEPVLKIPQPDGWDRQTALDSELIRYALRANGLQRDGFAPTAVVTFETVPGTVDPAAVFDGERESMAKFGASDMQITDQTLCGLPAQAVNYTAPVMGPVPPRPAMMMCVVMHANDQTYAAAVTVQSTDPDNSTYQRDAHLILSGFQMLPPSTN